MFWIWTADRYENTDKIKYNITHIREQRCNSYTTYQCQLHNYINHVVLLRTWIQDVHISDHRKWYTHLCSPRCGNAAPWPSDVTNMSQLVGLKLRKHGGIVPTRFGCWILFDCQTSVSRYSQFILWEWLNIENGGGILGRISFFWKREALCFCYGQV